MYQYGCPYSFKHRTAGTQVCGTCLLHMFYIINVLNVLTSVTYEGFIVDLSQVALNNLDGEDLLFGWRLLRLILIRFT